jgi:DNA invertase Pin-like site-specific DNA recombinase
MFKALNLATKVAGAEGRAPLLQALQIQHLREQRLRRLGPLPRQGRRRNLAIACTRRQRGESVTAIARHLNIGRSTLYRALAEADAAETESATI